MPPPYRVIERTERAVIRRQFSKGMTALDLAKNHQCSLRTIRKAINNAQKDVLDDDEKFLKPTRAHRDSNARRSPGSRDDDHTSSSHRLHVHGKGPHKDASGVLTYSMTVPTSLNRVEKKKKQREAAIAPESDALRNFLTVVGMNSPDNVQRFADYGIRTYHDVHFLRRVLARNDAAVREDLIHFGFTRLEILSITAELRDM